MKIILLPILFGLAVFTFEMGLLWQIDGSMTHGVLFVASILAWLAAGIAMWRRNG